MSSVVLGALAACAASSMYNLGVALQAVEARVVPAAHGLRPSLVGRLLRRPRWLAGTALGLLGWPLQAVALLLAPLTVVQPALAFGLVLLLVLGTRTLHERIGARDVLAVAAIIGGVAFLAAVAPPASSHHVGGWPLAAALAALGAVALAPYALRGGRGVGGIAAALSAGAAFAWSGLSTKFVADALSAHQWATAVAWTLATGLSSLLALLSEMSALQRRPATQVAPFVFVVQVVIPVLAAPLLTGESWARAPLGAAGVLAGLAIVIGGAVAVTAARPVRALDADEPNSADSGTALSPVERSEAAVASAAATEPSEVTTITSPAAAPRTGPGALVATAPRTGDASSVRASRY
jgi:drug/metabolite transporter (DMT)-like permease